MSQHVEISNEAYALLESHRKLAGYEKTIEEEMDELFTVMNEVWSIIEKKDRDLLATIRKWVNQ